MSSPSAALTFSASEMVADGLGDETRVIGVPS